MNEETALADRILALGVGHIGYDRRRPTGYRFNVADRSMGAVDFLRDARVAMALMERCTAVESYWLPNSSTWSISADAGRSKDHRYHVEADSLPRAIVEACMKALEEE